MIVIYKEKEFEIECENDIPTDIFWRRRLRDESATIKELAKKEAKKTIEKKPKTGEK